jgi:hypothetical protein
MKKLLVAMALGAALAWLFDPDAGSRRRDAVRSKLESSGFGSSTPGPPAARSNVADNGPMAPTVASIP